MRAVSYVRVSTVQQAKSGLGLEAQRLAIANFCNERGWQVIDEFEEVGGAKSNDRPQLHSALHRCRVSGATLVVATLDRLSRDVAYVSKLLDSPVRIVVANFPEADKMTLQLMAVFAEREREYISRRTREGLQRKKEAGVKLGNPNGAAALRRAGKGNAAAVAASRAAAAAFAADLEVVLQDLRAEGHRTLRALADELNARRILTRRGRNWRPGSVHQLLTRLGGKARQGAEKPSAKTG